MENITPYTGQDVRNSYAAGEKHTFQSIDEKREIWWNYNTEEINIRDYTKGWTRSIAIDDIYGLYWKI